MTEEFVTKSIMQYLKSNGWTIICFDFPQSGTGKVIHPNDRKSKNLDSFIPDIVTVKNETALFFENKNRFYYKDYEKIYHLKNTNGYSNDISILLSGNEIKQIFYGIGLPVDKHKRKSIESQNMVDFIFGVNNSSNVTILYNMTGINY